MKSNFLIYTITFNNNIIYVGQTKKGLAGRVQTYKRAIKDVNKKTYIVNHLRKTGIENNIFSIVENCKDQEELNIKEVYFIDKYDTFYPKGKNLTIGGECTIISEISRRKMSLARIGVVPWNKGTKGLMGDHWTKFKKCPSHSLESRENRKRFGEENHFYGKTHTNESKQKMSKSLLGRKAWNANNDVKIKQVDEFGNVINTFLNKKDIIELGFDRRSINRCLKQPYLKHKGFYFLEIK